MSEQNNAPISGRWGIPKPFDHTNIPNFILDHYASLGVSNIQMILIIHLASFRYDSDKTQGARPSINTLAELMNLSYKSVLTHLQKLHEDGWVIIHSGKEDGKPSEYDFSPLTLKCLSIAKQGGVKKDSHPRYEKRFRGTRYQPMKKDSDEEEDLKQEEKQQEAEPDSPSFDLGIQDSQQESTLLIYGQNTSPINTNQEETTRVQNTSGVKKRSSARTISESVTDTPPSWHNPNGPRIYAPLANSLPSTWTPTHLHIYLTWYGKPTNKPAQNSYIRKTEGIYAAFASKSQEAPLATAIDTFIAWYRSQSWVVEIAQREHMGVVEQVDLPLPENMGKHLDRWTQAQPPRRPAYTPREHTAPPKRGNVFSRGGGV